MLIPSGVSEVVSAVASLSRGTNANSQPLRELCDVQAKSIKRDEC